MLELHPILTYQSCPEGSEDRSMSKDSVLSRSSAETLRVSRTPVPSVPWTKYPTAGFQETATKAVAGEALLPEGRLTVKLTDSVFEEALNDTLSCVTLK